jgi:hypothetical protein
MATWGLRPPPKFISWGLQPPAQSRTFGEGDSPDLGERGATALDDAHPVGQTGRVPGEPKESAMIGPDPVKHNREGIYRHSYMVTYGHSRNRP